MSLYIYCNTLFRHIIIPCTSILPADSADSFLDPTALGCNEGLLTFVGLTLLFYDDLFWTDPGIKAGGMMSEPNSKQFYHGHRLSSEMQAVLVASVKVYVMNHRRVIISSRLAAKPPLCRQLIVQLIWWFF